MSRTPATSEPEDSALVKEFRLWWSYDPITGNFYWIKAPRGKRHLVGKIAGTHDNNGYIILRLNRRAYKAHRVAWAFVYGKMPDKDIDHWDQDESNNSFFNLREADDSQNQGNCTRKTNSFTKMRGVYPSGNKWNVSLVHRGIKYYLGTFDSPDQAQAAYKTKHIELHKEFSSEQSI